MICQVLPTSRKNGRCVSPTARCCTAWHWIFSSLECSISTIGTDMDLRHQVDQPPNYSGFLYQVGTRQKPKIDKQLVFSSCNCRYFVSSTCHTLKCVLRLLTGDIFDLQLTASGKEYCLGPMGTLIDLRFKPMLLSILSS